MTSAPRPLPAWLTVSTGQVVDGRACRTRAAFFEEVARALRFPAYFGRNWDALTDCLRDTGAVELVVGHAEELLADEPGEQLATLLTVLADASRDGLTVTLCTDAGHDAALRERVAAALT
ncbi:barstar family protein [Nonomuraea rubra]|uniref:barstar family protein n=1 Tax=Nonomuraea rubra TaxID=46180 RepID=UPI0033FEFCF4